MANPELCKLRCDETGLNEGIPFLLFQTFLNKGF